MATLRAPVPCDEMPVTWSVENGNVLGPRSRLAAWITAWRAHARALVSRLHAHGRTTLDRASDATSVLTPRATLPVAGPQRTRTRRMIQAAVGISLACALAFALALPNSPGAVVIEQPHRQGAVPSLVAAAIETAEPASKAAPPEAVVLDRTPTREDTLAAQVAAAPSVAPPSRVQMGRASRAVKRADTLFKRGKLGPASASYRYALANAPENAEAMAGLARVHLRRKEGGEALKLAQHVVAQHGRDSGYLLLLGDAWALQANPAQARDAWTRAAAYGNRTALQRLRSSLEADESAE